MNEVIFQLMRAAMIAILAILAAYIRPAVKSYISQSQFSRLIDVAGDAVKAVEKQLGGKQFGEVKKQAARDIINKICAERNVVITDAQVDSLIESACKTMDDESGLIIAEPIKQASGETAEHTEEETAADPRD